LRYTLSRLPTGTTLGLRLRAALLHAPLVVLLLPAVGVALQTTRGLDWPYDVDFYRAIAQAQVFADGSWNGESFYRGGLSWDPALVPAIVAVVSKLAGDASIPKLFVSLGPWLNLLGPVALYVLCLRFFGRGAALFATVDYLYLRPAWLPAFA